MAPFLLGKLPAHGDFVTRGLALAQRDQWDGWGAAALDALRACTGGLFDAAHAEAPAWRFVTASAQGWRAGALAPSVDAVGRRFLLLVGLDGLSPALAGAAGLALADAAEALAFDAIAGGWDADHVLAAAEARLGAALASGALAAPLLAAAPQGEGGWWTLGSATCPPASVAGRDPPLDLFARTVTAPSLEAVA